MQKSEVTIFRRACLHGPPLAGFLVLPRFATNKGTPLCSDCANNVADAECWLFIWESYMRGGGCLHDQPPRKMLVSVSNNSPLWAGTLHICIFIAGGKSVLCVTPHGKVLGAESVLPNSYAETLTLTETIFGDRAFMKVIKG